MDIRDMSVNCEVKNMIKSVRAWKMKIKKVGNISPPKTYSNGRYGGLKKFSKLTIKRLNGIAILTRSLGCIWSYGKCYRNPPVAPPFRNSLRKILRGLSLKKNRIGTIQGQLSYLNGQN